MNELSREVSILNRIVKDKNSEHVPFFTKKATYLIVLLTLLILMTLLGLEKMAYSAKKDVSQIYSLLDETNKDVSQIYLLLNEVAEE